MILRVVLPLALVLLVVPGALADPPATGPMPPPGSPPVSEQTTIPTLARTVDDSSPTVALGDKTSSSTATSPSDKSGLTALDYLNLLEEKNKDVRSMAGAFVQIKESSMFLEKNIYMGRFCYLKPNRFRVDYTEKGGKKEDSTLLMLAEEMWDYVPSIQQATRISLRTQTGRQREINQFLLGFGIQSRKALEYFDVKLGKADSSGRTFTLLFKAKDPDETMQFTEATITFDRASLRPKTIVLAEQYGDQTEIQLGDVKFNETVKESLFTPDWPKGTVTIDQ